MEKLLACLPDDLAEEIVQRGEVLSEIRIRSGRQTQLCFSGGDRFVGAPITSDMLMQMVLSMMDHSYYTKEDELSQGFFTMTNGFRVGVCGAYSTQNGKVNGLRSIGSICIRIARESKGCAEEFVNRILDGNGVSSALILSRPGMGKTTMLRDAARILSYTGMSVGIADERHEIAACCNGVPTLDVGPRTDVADGCPKAHGMELLVRSMAPKVVVTDEIGNSKDADAVRNAALKGTAVLASAHAASFSEAFRGEIGGLLKERIFETVFLLGDKPGRIVKVLSKEMMDNV